MRKLVLLGTSGSGKTTFLKNLAGNAFNSKSEVTRNVEAEEFQQYNTFTPIDKSMFQDSTTTVSINTEPILFYTTKTNEFGYQVLKSSNGQLPRDDIDNLYPTIIYDPAGQERFSFMQEIGLKGADAVFIFADGSNVQSIERISHYVNMVQEASETQGKGISITIFVNKKDLESRGLFIGIDSVRRWIKDESVLITPTSNLEPDTFNIPLRNLLDRLPGFPIPVEKVLVKA